MTRKQQERIRMTGLRRVTELTSKKRYREAIQTALDCNLRDEIVPESEMDEMIEKYSVTDEQLRQLAFVRIYGNPWFLNLYGQKLYLKRQVKSFKIKELLEKYDFRKNIKR